ncbi:MAG: hypothetical protein K1X78_27545 [Verrucomicrobiaceae bacterium]|nr:hypothetical protein [Verrucomicrobiaceae bacterium]
MIRRLSIICLAVLALGAASCDKHSWKETQVLQEKFGEHHGKAGAEHGAAAGGHTAPAQGHDEKK